MTEKSGKLVRWRLSLYELVHDIVHRAGVKHQAADAISRMERTGTNDTELNDQMLILTMEGKKEDEYSMCFECDNVEKCFINEGFTDGARDDTDNCRVPKTKS